MGRLCHTLSLDLSVRFLAVKTIFEQEAARSREQMNWASFLLGHQNRRIPASCCSRDIRDLDRYNVDTMVPFRHTDAINIWQIGTTEHLYLDLLFAAIIATLHMCLDDEEVSDCPIKNAGADCLGRSS